MRQTVNQRGVRAPQAEYLRNLVGAQHYLAIRNCLADAGVIRVDGHYVPGEKSLGYRIGPLFERSQFRRFLLTDPLLIRRVRTHLPDARAETPADPVLRGLKRWLDEVEVDYESALGTIAAGDFTPDSRRAKELSVEALHDRTLYLKEDNQGRVYTNVVNIWSPLRHHLTVRSEYLTNIDICNSQPLFFGMLVLHQLKSKTLTLKSNTPSHSALFMMKTVPKTLRILVISTITSASFKAASFTTR